MSQNHPSSSSDAPSYEPTGGARLRPALGLFTAVTIVVGGMIGSGIFLMPSKIAADFTAVFSKGDLVTDGNFQGIVWLILALWVLCGIINLCGALSLSELASMMPHAGGTYVFLREAYGRLWAFLWAWAEFWVIRSGAIAALACGFSISLRGFIKEQMTGGNKELIDVDIAARWNDLLDYGIPIGLIAILAFVNMIGVHWGGAVQNVTTLVKAGFVAFLAILPFAATGTGVDIFSPLPGGTFSQKGIWVAISGALAGIMWAYDGWGNVTTVAEEIKQPHRNLPRALGLGVLAVIVLYFGANLAYHKTVPVEKMSTFKSGAAVEVTEILMGPIGAKLVLSMMMVSIFGALNTNILAGPRIVFAVGRDHSFLGVFGFVNKKTGTPIVAIGSLAVWSCLLILGGTLIKDQDQRPFDILTKYCIFGGSLFYLAAVVAVYVLRVKRPDAERPYKTWGYPVVPMIFILFYIFFLAGMAWNSPRESSIGLLLIVAGGIFYLIATKRDSRSSSSPTNEE